MMDPLERVKLERRIDDLLKAKNSDVQILALKAKEELKAKHWDKVEPLVAEAEAIWVNVRPRRVVDLLVGRGDASSPAAARRLIQQGRVLVNGVVLRKPFDEVGPGDRVALR